MDYSTLNKMCDWERQKAMFLVSLADTLDIDTEGYGELGVNQSNGYTYLWLEDYNFTLFMPINCKLIKRHVTALWSNPEDGQEWGMDLEIGTSLKDIEEFCENCEAGETDDYDQY